MSETVVEQQPQWDKVGGQKWLGGLITTELYHEAGSETEVERSLAETYPEGHPYHGVGMQGGGGMESGNYLAKVRILGVPVLNSRTTLEPKDPYK